MMKRILFLGLAFSACVGTANAQSYGTQIGKTSYDLQTNSATANRLLRHADGTISAVWTEECSLNSIAPNRGLGYNYYDGNTWIHGPTGTCPDQFGIASKRTGWPEIVALPNGNEVVFSHDGNGVNMTRRSAKGTGGVGAWSTTTDLAFSQNITSVTDGATGASIPVTGDAGTNGTWPRAVAVGNTIHLVYSLSNGSTTAPATANGVASTFVYSRSTDGGQTWDKQNILIPGLDNTIIHGYPATPPNIGGDAYALTANGGWVAIVTGDFGDDWTIFKSSDNGSTWTRKFAREGFTPSDTMMINRGSGDYDTLAWTNDASHAVVIDNGGTVHVWGGQLLLSVAGANLEATGTYYPLAGDGILYWNDGFMANEKPALIAVTEDVWPTGDPNDWMADGSSFTPRGWTPYGTRSLTSMPNAAFDASTGDLYVVYSGAVEGTSNDLTSTGQPFRDLYVVRGERVGHSGIIWHRAINIAKEMESIPGDTIGTVFEEEVYPAVSRMIGSDGKLHIMWQHDFEPGLSVNGDLDQIDEYAIMYQSYDVSAINALAANDTAAVLSLDKNLDKFINEIKAYPNPTSDNVKLSINLKQSADVTVKIYNVMGQEVQTVPAKAMAAGSVNVVDVDMANLTAGVYYFTITSTDFTVTHRVVKQ